MSALTRWLDTKLYPSFQANWDDRLFRDSILPLLRPEQRLLDLGAGAGIVPHMNFKGLVARVCGVDPDERVAANPYLDEGRVGAGDQLPYEDDYFDLVIADNVVEHLAEPVRVFSEIRRVLKPGGVFLFKTPNKMHYVAGIARLTPHRFHQTYNRMRGRASLDTFPTRYRMNTKADVVRGASESGLVLENVAFFEGRPEYLRPFALAYLAGWVYERAVNGIPAMEKFRVVMIARLRKPDTMATPEIGGPG